MIYLERKIPKTELENYKRICILFKFYDNHGKLKDFLHYEFHNENSKYYLNTKKSLENAVLNIPIYNVDKMLEEINEWISHNYYCNEKGSIIIYTIAEVKDE